LALIAFIYSAFFNDKVNEDCKQYLSQFIADGDHILKNLELSNKTKKEHLKKLNNCKQQLKDHGYDIAEFVEELNQ